jgi:hypothetical protein
VLEVVSVAFALLGTGEAGRRAIFDRCAKESEIRFGLPCQDAAGCVACVGAVEVEPYAADQLMQITLAQTGVRAGNAAGGAVEALLNAPQKRLLIEVYWLRVELEDLRPGHRMLT